MSDEAEELFQDHQKTANAVLAELKQLGGETTEATLALVMLVGRILRSVEVITDIFHNRPVDAEFDGATILRGVYDTHLQALYILKDPEPRAKLYLDFFWVEWKRYLRTLQESDTKIAKRIMGNAVKSADKLDAEKQFDAVKDAFERKDKPKQYRKNWYGVSDLAQVARDVGYESEFLFFSRLLNPVVHSSHFGLRADVHPTGRMIKLFGWTLLMRVLGRVAEYEGVKIPPEVSELFVKPAYDNIFSPRDLDKFLDGLD